MCGGCATGCEEVYVWGFRYVCEVSSSREHEEDMRYRGVPGGAQLQPLAYPEGVALQWPHHCHEQWLLEQGKDGTDE